LLPGVTVQTAAPATSAFSAGHDLKEQSGRDRPLGDCLEHREYLRHKGDTTCSYLGILLLKQRNPDPRTVSRQGSPTDGPRALLGLIRSCGLASEKGDLTRSG